MISQQVWNLQFALSSYDFLFTVYVWYICLHIFLFFMWRERERKWKTLWHEEKMEKITREKLAITILLVLHINLNRSLYPCVCWHKMKQRKNLFHSISGREGKSILKIKWHAAARTTESQRNEEETIFGKYIKKFRTDRNNRVSEWTLTSSIKFAIYYDE